MDQKPKTLSQLVALKIKKLQKIARIQGEIANEKSSLAEINKLITEAKKMK